MKIKDIQRIQKEGLELMVKKNHDYASKIDNISMTGLTGVAIRLIDKVSRLYTLVDNDAQITDESIRDTLIDVMNYGTIGVSLYDGTWYEEDTKILKNFKDIKILDEDDGEI